MDGSDSRSLKLLRITGIKIRKMIIILTNKEADNSDPEAVMPL